MQKSKLIVVTSLIFFSLIAFTFPTISCNASKVNYQPGSIYEVFQKAKSEKKKVFLIMEDSNCEKCMMFPDFINSKKRTVDILNKDFICYRVNNKNINHLPIVQVLKCPSFPFPFFFDNDGTLISFGFPNDPNFDISNLDSITINKYLFSELFNLGITLEQYKTLVTQNMKAFLLMENLNNPSSLKSAYEFTRGSLDIAVYPYNLFYSNLLKEQLSIEENLDSYRLKTATPSDSIIYGNIFRKADSLGIGSYFSVSPHFANLQPDFLLEELSWQNKIVKGLAANFEFKIRNTGKETIIIKSIRDQCGCINVQWTPKSIDPGRFEIVKGTFVPSDSGEFKKLIHIHSNSKHAQVKDMIISGYAGM
jgi:thioredoxin-related protein